jgi:hypothetical protein
MDDDTEERLRHDIGFIICRLVTWPRYRREMTDLVRGCIAGEIVKHLKLSNWRFTKGPPTPWRSTTSGHDREG